MTEQREESRVGRRARPEPSDLIVGAASILLGIPVIIYSRTMPTIGEGDPGPGLFPGMIGALFVLFGAALVVKALVVARRGGAPAEAGDGAAPTAAAPSEVPDGAVPAAEADDTPPAGGAGDTGVTHAALATTTRGRWINGAVILGAIIFYILAAELLGFPITMFVILAGIMLVLRSRVLPAVLTAAGVTALLYAVFELLLLVQLPDGLLG